MQTTFKLKLQNALNSVNFTDADSPALIVGGRRRNRKKRRIRHGQNKRKNRRGDSPTDTPAETPEPSRKLVTNHREPRPEKVSCLDIEEPIFVQSPKVKQVFTEIEKERDDDTEDILEENQPDVDETFEHFNYDDLIDNNDKESSDNKRGLPRHHSEDSGVFDDEEDLTQHNLVVDDNDDSALSEDGADSLENDPSEKTDTSKIANSHGPDELIKDADGQEIVPDDFEEVPINDIVGDEDEAEEVIIFDLTTFEHNTLEDGNHISQTDEKFQPKSLPEPTVLEDEIPQRISLDLLSDDEDDVVLFDAGSPKEPAIICNPLYEQSLREEQETMAARNYQVGFKPDFDTVNFIRLPASDKSAKKEMKESSPLIRKQSGDELPCCVIL